VPCSLIAAEEVKAEHVTCFQGESYESARNGNDIALWTVNGWVRYHIIGSW